MMTIIVAATRDMAIGRQGDLLYHISDDLKRFKSLTMGHPIIMGRKTFESFPKGALPGRRNIIVTRNPSYAAENVETASSVEEALAMCGDADCYVIGGGEIYRQALPMADRLELTLIDAECPDADTRFPHIDLGGYMTENPVFDRNDPRSGVDYCFLTIDLK
ncbi:MAG: dihydrofolate reductase [Duncaniella sp.]|nr:dihydrofolate reductase [Duncaniella sp.]